MHLLHHKDTQLQAFSSTFGKKKTHGQQHFFKVNSLTNDLPMIYQ